jgi:hypothetical protein
VLGCVQLYTWRVGAHQGGGPGGVLTRQSADCGADFGLQMDPERVPDVLLLGDLARSMKMKRSFARVIIIQHVEFNSIHVVAQNDTTESHYLSHKPG